MAIINILLLVLTILYLQYERTSAYYTEQRPHNNGYQRPKPYQGGKSQYGNRGGGYGGNNDRYQAPKMPYINDNFVSNYNQMQSRGDSYGGGGQSMNYNTPYQQPKYPVQAAVKSKFSVEYLDTNYPTEKPEPQIIEIAGSLVPIILQAS